MTDHTILWEQFIHLYVEGEFQNRRHRDPITFGERLYNRVTFDVHRVLFPNGTGEGYIDYTPRWELLSENVWDVLIDYSEEYMSVRMMFI